MLTSPSEACFTAHDFVGGSNFMPSCRFSKSAGSTVPTFNFLVVHQLCFNHAQAKVQPYIALSCPSSFKFFSDFCDWGNGGGFPASSRDSDMTPKTTKRAKTFKKATRLKLWPTWQVYLWDIVNIAAVQNIAISSKTYHSYNIDAAIYCYGPTLSIYLSIYLSCFSHETFHPRSFTLISQ